MNHEKVLLKLGLAEGDKVVIIPKGEASRMYPATVFVQKVLDAAMGPDTLEKKNILNNCVTDNVPRPFMVCNQCGKQVSPDEAIILNLDTSGEAVVVFCSDECMNRYYSLDMVSSPAVIGPELSLADRIERLERELAEIRSEYL